MSTCNRLDLQALGSQPVMPKNLPITDIETMIRENRHLVTEEPVEFKKSPVEVGDCRKITDRFRGIYRVYPNLIKKNQRRSTCNWLDLQALGSQPVMPKNLPNHCIEMHYNDLSFQLSKHAWIAFKVQLQYIDSWFGTNVPDH